MFTFFMLDNFGTKCVMIGVILALGEVFTVGGLAFIDVSLYLGCLNYVLRVKWALTILLWF